jgi:hypothetical protein
MDFFKQIDTTLEELIQLQRKKLAKLAAELGVKVTAEDILNPHDFPELIRSARFNFEDGVLAGLISAQMAVRRNRPPPNPPPL